MPARSSRPARRKRSCSGRRTRVRRRSCRASTAPWASARLRGVSMFPAKDKLTICFAHAAYQMQARFEARKTGVRSFQTWSYDDFVKRVGEADVVVSSGMWKNEIIPHAGKLRFIQSISSGMDQYSKEQLS